MTREVSDVTRTAGADGGGDVICDPAGVESDAGVPRGRRNCSLDPHTGRNKMKAGGIGDAVGGEHDC